MKNFEDFQFHKFLNKAINELGFKEPTPIQLESFSVVRSGSDAVGISQTGTGKTLAYLLPVLQDLKFSKQTTPRILILVPTRELVIQTVDAISDVARLVHGQRQHETLRFRITLAQVVQNNAELFVDRLDY